MREIFRFSNSEEKIVITLIFLFPLFALTIKGWVGVIAALLFLLSLALIVLDPRRYFCDRPRSFYLWFAAIAAPFIVAILVGVIRGGEFDYSAIDGPSRFLMAAILFTYLSKKDNHEYLRYIFFSIYLSIIGAALLASTVENQPWPDRWSTYFIDPNTLATLVICFFSLIFTLKIPLPKYVWLLVFSGFVVTVTILFFAQSRSSWSGMLALIVLSIAYLVTERRWRDVAMLLLVGFVSIWILDSIFGFVSIRYSDALNEVAGFVNGGNILTSVGMRLGLLQFSWDLFLLHPILGVPDGALPSLSELRSYGIDVRPEVFEVMSLAGPHNELVAHLLRHGAFGLLTITGIFLYPLYVCFRYRLRKKSVTCDTSDLIRGLAYFILVVLACGQSIEVLNLKMTSTVYAFILSFFSAALYSSLQKNKDQKFS